MKNEPVIYQWHFDLSIILLVMVMICFYFLIAGFRNAGKARYFWLAIFLFTIIEFSPLEFLGMHYYFSAHMISHVMLLLVCGPLLVISIPAKPLLPKLKSFSYFISNHSGIAWFCGVGIMWFWHIPGVFDASLAQMNEPLSFFPLLHAGSMLLAGMLFSWPLFGPYHNFHIHPLSGIIYLFTACISCSLLGLLITFAPLNTYHHYQAMSMMSNGPWGISRQQDQQAAGLIMWVPCCLVYLSGCFFLLYRFFTAHNGSQNEVPAKLNTLLHHHD